MVRRSVREGCAASNPGARRSGDVERVLSEVHGPLNTHGLLQGRSAVEIHREVDSASRRTASNETIAHLGAVYQLHASEYGEYRKVSREMRAPDTANYGSVEVVASR